MTRRSIVSHVAHRFPFIIGGYLAACAAATCTGLLVAALLIFGGGVLTGDTVPTLLIALATIIAGIIPAVTILVTMGAIPAALAVLVAETLRVRAAWIYGLAGALTGAAAYFTSSATAAVPDGLVAWLPFAAPAGLVGGVVYWIIAVHVGGRQEVAHPLVGPAAFPTQLPLQPFR